VYDDIKLISVDDHIIEHPRVWLDRLPSKYAEAAPQIVDLPPDHPLRRGSTAPMQQWMFEGVIGGTTGLSAVAGTDMHQRGTEPQHFDDMRPGYYDPVARLADMDEEGVWAEINFPNYAGFAGRRFWNASDPELANLCVSAWNDFAIDEWAAAAPERYIPLVIVPFWDAEASAVELERVAAKGARTLSFPDNPANLGLPTFASGHWDRIFSIAAEAEIPLSMHFGSGGTHAAVSKDASLAVTTTLMGSTLSHSMVELIFSPVFHQHPNLKVAYSEGQIGWMPFFIQRMDQVWDHYRFYKLENTINGEIPPSELFRKHVWGCFIDDPIGVKLRHEIGVDKIMFEADFPHADSIWPNSRTHAEKVLSEADASYEDAKLILEDNARKLFCFPA
jgi:predicted TIM-barrel fold metal-dependent hydrolase